MNCIITGRGLNKMVSFKEALKYKKFKLPEWNMYAYIEDGIVITKSFVKEYNKMDKEYVTVVSEVIRDDWEEYVYQFGDKHLFGEGWHYTYNEITRKDVEELKQYIMADVCKITNERGLSTSDVRRILDERLG